MLYLRTRQQQPKFGLDLHWLEKTTKKNMTSIHYNSELSILETKS